MEHHGPVGRAAVAGEAQGAAVGKADSERDGAYGHGRQYGRGGGGLAGQLLWQQLRRVQAKQTCKTTIVCSRGLFYFRPLCANAIGVPKEDISVKIGLLIRSERLRKGLSQERLAELADLHRTYIGMLERGDKNITVLKLNKVAAALGLSISEFFALL